MKKSITFLLYGLFVLLAACSDDSDTSPAPTLTTGSVVNLYSSEAIIEGSINIPEGSSVSEYGILYSTENSMDDTAHQPAISTPGGKFIVQLTDLIPNTTYFYCAYANGNFGTAKGDVKNFKTRTSIAPSLGALSVSGKTATGFTVVCSIEDEGGYKTATMGFYWKIVQSLEEIPGDEDNKISITDANQFSHQFTEVSPDAVYAIRAYASNQEGISYSKTLYVTLKDIPIISPCKQLGADDTSLNLQASILANAEGITEKGFCYSNIKQEPTISDTKVISNTAGELIQGTIKGISTDNQHFIRAYCIKDGTAYYSEVLTYGTRHPGIYSLDDLVAFRNAKNKDEDISRWKDNEGIINLYADIDMNSIDNWEPIKVLYFNETLNGNGHTLTNFKITSYKLEWDYYGYGFICQNAGGTIKNLNIGTGSYVTYEYEQGISSSGIFGTICGSNETPGAYDDRGNIINCTSSATIKIISISGFDNCVVGGIVGQNSSTITECDNTGAIECISKSAYVGGICGISLTGTLLHCNNSGAIGQGYECYAMGGIVANMSSHNTSTDIIQYCTNTGDLNGGSQAEYLGGICGDCGESGTPDKISIDQCVNEGKIRNGKTKVGGISGHLLGSISNCTNKGDITSSAAHIGNICGAAERTNKFINNASTGSVNGDPGVPIGLDERGPALDKTAITQITTTSAYIVSEVLDTGGSFVLKKGVCYSATSEYPTIYGTHTQVYTEGNKIIIKLEGLSPGTKYYICSYASNQFNEDKRWGHNYGEINSFTTLPQ